MANSLTIAGLEAGYGAVRVLHDVSVTVDGGTLLFQIAGTGAGAFDTLSIDGSLTLHGGVIEFDFIDGFAPSAGDRFDSFLVASGGIVGLEGAALRFDGLPAGFEASITDVDGALTLVTGVAAPVDEAQTWALLFAFVPLVGWVTRRRRAR